MKVFKFKGCVEVTLRMLLSARMIDGWSVGWTDTFNVLAFASVDRTAWRNLERKWPRSSMNKVPCLLK